MEKNLVQSPIEFFVLRIFVLFGVTVTDENTIKVVNFMLDNNSQKAGSTYFFGETTLVLVLEG